MNDSILGNVVLAETEKGIGDPLKWYYDEETTKLYMVYAKKGGARYVLISKAILDEDLGKCRFAYLENSRKVLLWNQNKADYIPIY